MTNSPVVGAPRRRTSRRPKTSDHQYRDEVEPISDDRAHDMRGELAHEAADEPADETRYEQRYQHGENAKVRWDTFSGITSSRLASEIISARLRPCRFRSATSSTV